MKIICIAIIFIALLSVGKIVFSGQDDADWTREWSHTDFSKSIVDSSEIISGGPPKNGIRAIDAPKFKTASQIHNIGDKEPVIRLTVNGKTKAYPLRILMRHEIANDIISNTPVAVTYCPLCNAAIVFERSLNGQVLDFGVSGKLRHSDMIMYDRQSESWWQQFTGKAIVGSMTGTKLKRLPASVIPFATFKSKYPNSMVMVAPNFSFQSYGSNPYVKYDSSLSPFLYRGNYDGIGNALSYVVSIENNAWLLEDLRKVGSITYNDLQITWHEGMNSALDTSRIDQGRDIGFITAQRKNDDGYEDIPYDTTFAFAFKAFHPDGVIHVIEN